MDSAVSLEHVTIKYETDSTNVFTDYSVEILPGEKMVFAGPSGVGKSTLMNTIMGFVTPVSGTVKVNGITVNPANIVKVRQQFAWLPQELSFDIKSCRELAYFPFHYEFNKKLTPTESELQNMLEKLLLPSTILEKDIDEISGGQLQRLSLASVLLLKRSILLLDEPTSALDSESANAIINYLKCEKGITVISSSHDNFWKQNMDKVIEIKK